MLAAGLLTVVSAFSLLSDFSALSEGLSPASDFSFLGVVMVECEALFAKRVPMGKGAGRIASGMVADLLLIGGDPIADPRLLADARALRAVMKGGQWHKAPTPISQSAEEAA